jgi:hypothetical protein
MGAVAVFLLACGASGCTDEDHMMLARWAFLSLNHWRFILVSLVVLGALVRRRARRRRDPDEAARRRAGNAFVDILSRLRHPLAVAAVLGALAWCGIAHAQPIDPATVNRAIAAASSHDWQTLAAVLLPIAAWALRRYAAPAHFFHTKAGALVIAAALALVGAFAPILDAHALTVQSAISAGVTAVLALIAMSNPTALAGDAVKSPAGADAAKAALVLLAIGSLTGCEARDTHSVVAVFFGGLMIGMAAMGVVFAMVNRRRPGLEFRFGTGLNPSGEPWPEPPSVSPSFVSTKIPGGLLLALLSVWMACPGCATFRAQPVALQHAEMDALKCGVEAVQKGMQAAAPAVLDDLAGESETWAADLGKSELQVGENALVCAVAHALFDALGGNLANLAAMQRAAERQLLLADAAGTLVDTPRRRVLLRGLEYLHAKGYGR